MKYVKTGYYGEDCLCETCTGNNTRDVSILKRKADDLTDQQDDLADGQDAGGEEKRRSGR